VTDGATNRRIGRKDSKTRARLLDAAERLLLTEGYAAVTSRRVAAAAGLKPQLVHYYFRTMDDLYLEVFRRRADANLVRFERAIADDPSIETLWRLNADWRGSAFTLEFAALANHRKEIRAEIARYATIFRELQLDALAAGLARAGVTNEQIPPIVALVIMTGIGQVIAIENGLGISEGHDETIAYVERAIERMEGPPNDGGRLSGPSRGASGS
jgi:AcrR family transcriptional regulator